MATGKNTLAIRKKDLPGQIQPAVGIKKLVFAHKFVGGESGVNLLSLTTPTTEMVGFVNPNAVEIASAGLLVNRNNLVLMSSARGVLFDYMSYTIGSNTQINFTAAFGTALAGEVIVGVMQSLLTSGAAIVDANAISVSGTLLAGQTDIVVPPFEAAKNVTTSNIGAVMLVMDNQVRMRNPGNATAGAGQDTNNSHYEEVNAGNGMSNLIRMNTSEAFDRKYTVMSIGHSAFKPSESFQAAIDLLGGQMDKVINVLSDTSGQPVAYFQNNPNALDFRTFGNTVYANTASIASQGTRITTLEIKPDSEIILHTGNGHGSTNTRIRRFSTVQVNIGTAMTLTQSATLGDSITILKNGIYGFFYIDRRNSSTTGRYGISKNSASLTTDIDALPTAEQVFWCYAAEAASNVQGASGFTGVTLRLQAGDVIRAHTDAGPDNTVAGATRFHATQIVLL